MLAAFKARGVSPSLPRSGVSGLPSAPHPAYLVCTLLQFVFAIAVFAPLAEMAGWDYGPAVLALLTGISAMVLATLWIVGMVCFGGRIGRSWHGSLC